MTGPGRPDGDCSAMEPRLSRVDHLAWQSERPWKGISYLVLDEAGVHCDAAGVVHVPYRNLDGSVYREHLFAAGGRSWWTPGGRAGSARDRTAARVRTARRFVLIIS